MMLAESGDRTAVRGDDGMGDGESEAVAASLAAAGSIRTVEALKKFRLCAIGHGGGRIGDGEQTAPPLFGEGDVDVAGTIGVF